MKKTIANISFFSLILILICLPAFQAHVPFINSEKLFGYLPAPDTPVFSDSTWFDGSFQESTENYLKRNVGFHPDLVRLNNQLRFSVLKNHDARGILTGQNGHRYALQYIQSYTGTDYVGINIIRERSESLGWYQTAWNPEVYP